MKNPKYVYWKGEEASKWKKIRANKAEIEKAKTRGAKYITIAQFTEDSDGNPSQYYAPLYFDFDAEDIEDAINDVQSLMNTLKDELGYPINVAKIFLTGGRGLHVELPSYSFGSEDGDPNLPHIYKAMAESFGLKTMDKNVYSQRSGRMWRAVNLKRSNGNYKIPISVKELLELKVSELVALTKSPRPDFKYSDSSNYPVCEALKAKFLQKKHEYYWRKDNSNFPAIPSSKIQKSFNGTLPACIQSVINAKDMQNGVTNFNAMATLAACYYVPAGLKASIFLEDMEDFCENNFLDSKHYKDFAEKQQHLQNQYEYVSSNPQYKFSCGLLKSLRKNNIVSFNCKDCLVNETEKAQQKTKKNDSYTLIDANELLNIHVDRHDPIIEELVPARSIVTISGDTGVGKSLFVHSLCISVTLGLDEFLDFRIYKPRKVLYINLELNLEYLQDRHQKLINHIRNNLGISGPNLDRLDNLKINILDKDTHLFEFQWDRITTTLRCADPPFELVVIDNLYCASNADEEKNYQLKPLLGMINQLRHEFSCTFILVTHHTKRHFDDKILQLSMIRGGSTLPNFSDVVLQMTKSNLVEGLRIFKPTKERGGGRFEDIPIGIILNPKTLWFKNMGVIDNEIIHLGASGKSDMQKALDTMDEKFSTNEFEEYVTNKIKKSKRTAKYWLSKLTDRGQIRHIVWGKYEKVIHKELA